MPKPSWIEHYISGGVRNCFGKSRRSCDRTRLLKSNPDAREGEVVRVIGPAVLPRHDMLDVMREPALLLPEQAVLAPMTGPLADEFSRVGVPQAAPSRPRWRSAFILR